MGERSPIFLSINFRRFILGVSFFRFGCLALTIGLGFITLEIDFRKPDGVSWFSVGWL